LFETHVFDQEVPLMLLSYLGALKSWIYFPILDRIRPSYLTVRLPVLLIGSVTIWLFIWLLEKLHGRKVALVGGALLATDTMFLMTTCYDWGPVALQHLLALAGIAFLFKFAISGRRWLLFFGFFWFGLAFWDKALFVWLFSGLAVAAIAVFPRELWSRCSLKNLGLAAAGLLVGALPLVAYNVASDFATLRSNSTFVPSQFPSRVHALRVTWEGRILFEYMVHAPWAPGNIRDPDTELFDISDEVHSLVGFRYHYYNALEPAFLLALLLGPFLWFTAARKPMLFCLIVMVVAWLQMAFTKDAGLGAHHTVLLWPFPHWFLAVAFVQAAAWRPLQWKHAGAILLATVVLFLAVDNLLLTNEYYYQLSAYGPVRSWDDAIFQLSEEAGHIQGAELAVDDWGILNPLIVLHRNRLPLYVADQSFLAQGMGEDDRRYFMKRLAGDVWIGHTAPFQQLPGINDRMVRLAREAGFEKRMIETVRDRNGQPVFEIFRFVPSGGTAK
jgi:Dolichyl-phosphate-mannose-protein mannosyltransferase